MSTVDVSTKTTNVSNYRKPIIPDSIFIPEYLSTALEKVSVPNSITMDKLIDIGITLYTAKVRSVEADNIAGGQGNKRRVPDKLDFDDVAIILMSLYTFKNIQMTERTEDTLLGVYVEDELSDKYGTYSTNTHFMFEIMERLAPSFKTRDMEDVLDKIERSIPTVEQTTDRYLFSVNNGVYNQKTKELQKFNSDYIYLTKIPVDYEHSPKSPVIKAPDGFEWEVNEWIADIMSDDDEATDLMWQVIADSLQPHYSRNKSIWFYSEKGNNGKGTIGQLIKNLLGKGNYASLSVADFNHEFLKETLLGVAANISDENDVDVYIDSIKDYKASVTGDDININRKYEKPLRIQFLGTNIQMMNGLPKTKDRSDSFYRRIILVPFLKSFTNNGERTYIKDDYINREAVLKYVLNKALNIKFEEYIVPASSARLMESYKEMNNPVLEFWNQLQDEFVWDLLPSNFMYDLFSMWHEENNPSGKVMSSRTFNDTLTSVILTQNDPWEIKTGQNDKVRSDGRMGDDEPLITQYGLDRPNRNGKPSNWVKKDYTGDNDIMRREFTRRKMYRGYIRVDHNNIVQED